MCDLAVKLIFNYKSFNDVIKKIPPQDALVNSISIKLGRKKMLCKEKEVLVCLWMSYFAVNKKELYTFLGHFGSRSKIFSFHSQDSSTEYNSKLEVYYVVDIC